MAQWNYVLVAHALESIQQSGPEMDYLGSIGLLNEIGIGFLKAGDPVKALEVFGRAMDMNVKWNQDSFFFPHSSMLCIPAEGNKSVSLCHSVSIDDSPGDSCSSSSSSSVQFDHDQDARTSPSNMFCIFKKALSFDFDRTQVEALRKHLPSLILYNMGLVYHRKAADDGDSSSFLKAQELYALSLFLLEEAALHKSYVSQFNLLLIALLNQLGYIASHFRQTLQAQQYLDQLNAVFIMTEMAGNVLTYEVACHTPLIAVPTFCAYRLLTRDEYLFFYMSILFGRCLMPQLAPAA